MASTAGLGPSTSGDSRGDRSVAARHDEWLAGRCLEIVRAARLPPERRSAIDTASSNETSEILHSPPDVNVARGRVRMGTGEELVYSTLALAVPVVVWLWPDTALRWLVLDDALFFGAAVLCAAHLRGPDVLMWFPTFPLMRVMSCAVWLRSFWTEIVRRRTLRTWVYVARHNDAE